MTPAQREIYDALPEHIKQDTSLWDPSRRGEWESYIAAPPDSLVNKFPPEEPPSGTGDPAAPTTQDIDTLNRLQDDYRRNWDPRLSDLNTGAALTRRQDQLNQGIPAWKQGLSRLEPGLGDRDIGELGKRRDELLGQEMYGGGVSEKEKNVIRTIEKIDELTREKQRIDAAVASNDRMQEALGNQGRSRTQGLPEPPDLMKPRDDSHNTVHVHVMENQTGGGKSLLVTPTSATQCSDGSIVLFPDGAQADGVPKANAADLTPDTFVRDSAGNKVRVTLGGVDYNRTKTSAGAPNRTRATPHGKNEDETGKYPNPAIIPYAVANPKFIHEMGLNKGDLVTIINRDTGKVTYGAALESSGSRPDVGEVSLFTSKQHGTYEGPEKSTAGSDQFIYIFHNGSRNGDAWPQTREEIQQAGRQAFQDWGGKERLQQMGVLSGAPATGSTTATAPSTSGP